MVGSSGEKSGPFQDFLGAAITTFGIECSARIIFFIPRTVVALSFGYYAAVILSADTRSLQALVYIIRKKRGRIMYGTNILKFSFPEIGRALLPLNNRQLDRIFITSGALLRAAASRIHLRYVKLRSNFSPSIFAAFIPRYEDTQIIRRRPTSLPLFVHAVSTF